MAKTITRTRTVAKVSYEKCYKDESGVIVKDVFDTTIFDCNNETSAEVAIERENRGAIVSILSIGFEKIKYSMDAEKFYRDAEQTIEPLESEVE